MNLLQQNVENYLAVYFNKYWGTLPIDKDHAILIKCLPFIIQGLADYIVENDLSDVYRQTKEEIIKIEEDIFTKIKKHEESL